MAENGLEAPREHGLRDVGSFEVQQLRGGRLRVRTRHPGRANQEAPDRQRRRRVSERLRWPLSP